VLPVIGGGHREFVFNADAREWTEYVKEYPDSTAVMLHNNEPVLVSTSLRGTVSVFYRHNVGYNDFGFTIPVDMYWDAVSFSRRMGVLVTPRRGLVNMIAYDSEQQVEIDTDLWGYLLTSSKNDSVVASPFGTGSVIKSSEDGSHTAAHAFDGNAATYWSNSVQGVGFDLDIGFNAESLLLGGLSALPVMFKVEYSQTEYVGWDFGSTLSLEGVSFTPVAGGVKDFKIKYSVNGTDWTVLYVGVADKVAQFSRTFTPVDARYFRIDVDSVYSGQASVREIGVIVSADVSMQGYIFSKNPGAEIRKVFFERYTDMNGFITDWKALDASWADDYYAEKTAFDILDNGSISSALPFLTEAQLDGATTVEMEEMYGRSLLDVLFLKVGDDSTAVVTVILYKGDGVVGVTKAVAPVFITQIANEDGWDSEGSDIRVDLTGKGYEHFLRFQEDSDNFISFRGMEIWFSQGELQGEES
jgi:hypothetical protein